MKRILFTLFCFTLCAGISSAQESAEKELLRYKDKEIETLNENIKKLEGIIDGLQDKIKTLKKEIFTIYKKVEIAKSKFDYDDEHILFIDKIIHEIVSTKRKKMEDDILKATSFFTQDKKELDNIMPLEKKK